MQFERSAPVLEFPTIAKTSIGSKPEIQYIRARACVNCPSAKPPPTAGSLQVLLSGLKKASRANEGSSPKSTGHMTVNMLDLTYGYLLNPIPCFQSKVGIVPAIWNQKMQFSCFSDRS